MIERKVQGDPELAEMFERFGIRPRPSRIIETDIVATAFNREKLGKKRVVVLSCRHRAITGNQISMTCPRCVEMMKEGLDYDAWINGHSQDDGLLWPADPLRILNERTDLAGNFVDDLDCAVSPCGSP